MPIPIMGTPNSNSTHQISEGCVTPVLKSSPTSNVIFLSDAGVATNMHECAPGNLDAPCTPVLSYQSRTYAENCCSTRELISQHNVSLWSDEFACQTYSFMVECPTKVVRNDNTNPGDDNGDNI